MNFCKCRGSVTNARARERLRRRGYRPLGRKGAETLVRSGLTHQFDELSTVVFLGSDLSDLAVFVLAGRGSNECYVYEAIESGWWSPGTLFACE